MISKESLSYSMYGKALVIFIFTYLLVSDIQAQNKKPIYISDTTDIHLEGIPQIKSRNILDPSRAALLSAVLPGLGQAYNKKYWKIPIVWGGLFLGIYLANFYNDQLQLWRGELFLYINGQPTNPAIPRLRVEQIVQRYRRDRDQTTIYTFMWYGLNIVDAHVDAYLREFSVNDDLALKLEPYMDKNVTMPGDMFGGISLVLKIK